MKVHQSCFLYVSTFAVIGVPTFTKPARTPSPLVVMVNTGARLKPSSESSGTFRLARATVAVAPVGGFGAGSTVTVALPDAVGAVLVTVRDVTFELSDSAPLELIARTAANQVPALGGVNVIDVSVPGTVLVPVFRLVADVPYRTLKFARSVSGVSSVFCVGATYVTVIDCTEPGHAHVML